VHNFKLFRTDGLRRCEVKSWNSCPLAGYDVSDVEPSDPSARESVGITNVLERCAHSHLFQMPPLLLCVPHLSWCSVIARLIALQTSQSTARNIFCLFY